MTDGIVMLLLYIDSDIMIRMQMVDIHSMAYNHTIRMSETKKVTVNHPQYTLEY